MTPMHADPTTLQMVWFGLSAVLWLGYFFLEGFDYGVGMLLPVLARDDDERRVMINTIGPVWDGNEVWLLTAGGAMFAAFPGWYASLFSGLYLPLFLVLLGLILRGIAFEYRTKRDSKEWKAGLDWCATIGSFLPSLVFGIGFANFVKGIKVGPDQLIAQGFWSLFNPFALLGGVLFVVLFLAHGAVFIALKTKGEIRTRANGFALKATLASAVLMAAFVLWQNIAWPAAETSWLGTAATAICWVFGLMAVAYLFIAAAMVKKERDGWAFAFTGLAIAFLVIDIFAKMYGNLGFISADTGLPLDMTTASSSPYTLTLMTIASGCAVPVVVGYQAWSYWVFRKRLGVGNLPQMAITKPRRGASTAG
ncbi:MAG: cytochrome d ubiquinol oxidase subunit II [Luteococcus sp.]|uniref:cytochrome d ubiquinol oxidase subunit II n=1 Tax=Luteococcus sp. TaxID=1969402 RepID=UPI0026481AE5|nr:cytochrome d ubiquinol oxidase subunit II [Luteococcus sp.]MDN5563101.1 cytochrome d ubiquinol oxidase subunit II [Luteococcus sp.]